MGVWHHGSVIMSFLKKQFSILKKEITSSNEKILLRILFDDDLTLNLILHLSVNEQAKNLVLLQK